MKLSMGYLHVYAFLLHVMEVICGLKLPTDVSHDLYCSGCEAVISVIHSKMSRKSSDSIQVRVVELLEDICQNSNFRTFDYIPPKLVRACKHLISQHDEDMEQILIDHYRKKEGSQKAAEQLVCYNLSRACVGLQRDKKHKDEVSDEEEQQEKEFPDIDDLNIPGARKLVAEPVTRSHAHTHHHGDGNHQDRDEERRQEKKIKEEL